MPGFESNAPPGDPASGNLTGDGISVPNSAVPRYPSNYFDRVGNTAGPFAVDNIAARRELKHTTSGTPFQNGLYATNQSIGTQTTTNPTATLGDLSIALSQVAAEISALQTALAAVNAAGSGIQGLTANLDYLKIEHVMSRIQNVTFTMNRLTANFNEHVASGSLGVSHYPSGQNRGY